MSKKFKEKHNVKNIVENLQPCQYNREAINTNILS